MAKFVSEFKELEIGKIRFNKGVYITNSPLEITFLERMSTLKRYRINRIDPVASKVIDKDAKKK